MSKIEYRFIKSSWGIAIDLVGNHKIVEEKPHNAKLITPRIWLELQTAQSNLTEMEVDWIVKGLKAVSGKINSKTADSSFILINLTEITFNPCDYQQEGLLCAVIEWASNEFNFDTPEIKIEFDENKNRYLINGESERI